MSAVKGGKQREQKERELYVGLTTMFPVAVNPTREETNKLLDRDDSPEDKPAEYLGTDKDGNDRIRLAFWMKSEKLKRFFVHSFNIFRTDRKSNDGLKVQVVNSTLNTTWVPYLEGTDKPDGSVLPSWFTEFQDKEKVKIGDKKWRKAFSGEEELCTLVRSWLGKLNWNDQDTEVSFDIDKLFREDYSELRELINGDFSTPFVPLLGVRTDDDEKDKKYQQIWSKMFLPNGFEKYINNNFKFPSDYTKKLWDKFVKEAEGEYGFKYFTKLVLVEVYDESEDPVNSEDSKVVDKTSADY